MKQKKISHCKSEQRRKEGKYYVIENTSTDRHCVMYSDVNACVMCGNAVANNDLFVGAAILTVLWAIFVLITVLL